MKIAVVLGFLLACGGGGAATDAGDTEVDGSRDAGADPSDAGFDAGGDTGDSGEESGFDAGDTGDSGEDSGFDAGPEPCADEGAVRTAPCGNCGTGQERCQSGAWTLVACVGEGICPPGALEVLPQPMCGEVTRICTDVCEWLEEETRAPGVCDVGDTRFNPSECPVAEHRAQTCSSTCAWEDEGSCEEVCGPLRDTPRLRSEVCVPAGDFIRGENSSSFAFPEQLVTLTYDYVVDVFPITRAEFRRCVDAGSCSVREIALPSLEDPTQQGHVWRTFHAEALAYCAWDGRRRLPTEAEWEKVMRGPAPRDNLWPIEGEVWPCEDLPRPGCPNEDEFVLFRSVGITPATRSFYGAEDWEIDAQWVSDVFSRDYWMDPASLVDPRGPETGTGWVRKGRNSGIPEQIQLGRRFATGRTGLEGFRCARDI